jgi:glycerol-3-phosphate cytidylyltransferase
MKIIGYTTGVFDLFHIGHLNLLKRAKLECDYLIVGVTTDELSYSRKGKYPIIPFLERMEIVEHIKFVDEVVPQAHMDKMAAWRDLQFNKMFVGDDWKGSDSWNALENEFSDVGVEIVYFPYTRHTSSTKLRSVIDELLAQQEGEKAGG